MSEKYSMALNQLIFLKTNLCLSGNAQFDYEYTSR